MRIGSQPLTPQAQRPGAPTQASGVAPASSGRAVDTLERSGGGARDVLRAIKQSLVNIFNKLLGRDEPAPAPKPPAPAPVTPPTSLREKAEAIWFKGASLNSEFRQGQRDAIEANDLDEGADTQAAELFKANRPMEAEKLAAMPPAQQARYQKVMAMVSFDPQARLSMQVLLAEGKLPGKAKAKDGADLLTTLSTMADQPMAAPLEPSAVMADLIQEIAVPSAIDQKDKNTCCVASVQILTATQNPAEYARIVGGLASPEGRVTLASGETLEREPGTEADDASGRTDSSRLWQAAMTQFALGEVGYDNASDSRNDGKWGVFGHELDRVVDAMTNRDNRLLSTDDGYSGADLLRDITPQVQAGHPVPVCLDWGEAAKDGEEHPGHNILVTAIKDGQVYYDNPWGLQERMSVAEFEKRAWWANAVDMTK